MELSREQKIRLSEAVTVRADDERQAYLDQWTESFGLLQAQCESPIELLLGGYLLMISDGYGYVRFTPQWDRDRVYPGTVFGAQVAVGEYRCDFLFKMFCEGRTRLLVVECDGHDFHERTKEQARRDRRRDRWFAENGASVIRFTGSEIYRDPGEKAQEVSSRLTHLIEEMFVEIGVMQPRGRKPIA